MKILLAILFCALSLQAEPLCLADLIDIALKNNPETAKSWARVQRAQAVVGVAESKLYPWVDVSGSGAQALEKKFPNGNNTVFFSYSGELTLSYLLYDFGERKASIQATKNGLIAAQWNGNFEIQRVIAQVATHYYEYLNAIELLEVSESSLGDTQWINSAADELFRAGLRCSSDLNTSRAAVAETQMNLCDLRARVAIAYGKLMTSLGVNIDTKYEIETSTEGLDNPAFALGVSHLIAMANQQRADLIAKRATLDEMNELVRSSERASWPKVRALGQGGWLQYSRHRDSGYNYQVSLAVEVPVFKGFEYTYNTRVAYADAELTQAELNELQDTIALEVLTHSESVQAAQSALQWSEQFLDEATKSYNGSTESYKAGLQNIFDLLQTQRYLADARRKRALARTQWLVSLAQLAFATGSLDR